MPARGEASHRASREDRLVVGVGVDEHNSHRARHAATPAGRTPVLDNERAFALKCQACNLGLGRCSGSFDDLGTPLADTTFCVLDLETTGGNREHDSITEVGVVKVRGGECLGTFQTLVNPGRAIPPRISVLTGLTDAVVAPAPRIEAVLPSLLEFLGSGVIVGHNVGFDLAFLAPRCSGSAIPRSPRRGSTPRRSPAVSSATRCRTAGCPRSPRGCASTTAPPTAPSTTPSPRPTCSTCSSSGRQGSACSASTTS